MRHVPSDEVQDETSRLLTFDNKKAHQLVSFFEFRISVDPERER